MTVVRWIGVALAVALGCEPATPDPVVQSSAAVTKGSPAPGFATNGGAAPADTTLSSQDDCADAAKLVYVLSLEGDMYSFAPADKQFTKIGAIDCGSDFADWSTISMAVDRNAVAWVNLRSDTDDSRGNVLVKYDILERTCTPTQISGAIGGMAFSTDSTGDTAETLYVSGDSSLGGGLSKVDMENQKLVPIANYDLDRNRELTGTGDGRLFGFFVEGAMSFAQVDKSQATLTAAVPLTKIVPPLSPMFAFSFWGGDFFFYTATSDAPDNTTTVSRYSPSTGTLDTSYMTNIGFHITGAGVSTCAPTTAVK